MDDDTEPVGDFECGFGSRAVCDFEEEVVLDSEDERIDQCQTRQVKLANEPFIAKGAGAHDDVLELDIGDFDTNSSEKGNQLKSYAKEHDSSDAIRIESHVPKESSQDNALKFVESFLSYNDFGLSPEYPSTKMTRERSRLFLPAKGIQDVAKRINLIRPTEDMDPFEWVDTSCTEEGADVQASLYPGDLDKRFSEVKSAAMCHQTTEDNAFLNEHADDLESVCLKNSAASICSNSAFLQYHSVQSGQTSKIPGDIVENCGDGGFEVAETSGKQVQYVSVAGEEEDDDVGFCTQMAAEVMEALSNLPSCISTDFHEHTWHTPNISPHELGAHVSGSGDLPSTKNIFPDSGQRQLYTKRLATSTLPFKGPKKQKLDTELELLKKTQNANMSTNWPSRKKLSSPSHVSDRRPVKLKKRTEGMGRVKSNQMEELDHHKFPSSNHTLSWKKGQQEDMISSSAINRRTRQYRLGNKLKERVEDPENCSGRWTSSSMDSNNLKRSKHVHSSKDLFEGMARTRGVNREQQTEVGLPLLSRLDTWSYPKRKRTKCSVQRGRDDDACSLCDVTVANRGKTLQIAKPDVGTHFVDMDTDSIVEGDLLIQERCRSDREDDGSLMYHSKVKSSKKSTHKRPHSDNKGRRALLLEKNSGVENKFLIHTVGGKLANALTKKSTASNVFPRSDYHKEPCKKFLSNPTMSKELMRLGITEPMPDFTWKNLRKRRYIFHVRVLFSLHLGDNIVKKQKEILAKLHIPIATSSSDASHFIADKFTRTRNMLEFIAEDKPVVTHLWLESCGQVGSLIDEKNFILRDARKEKKLGFNMSTSLARAAKHPLLEGRKVFITPNVKPDKEMITSLVKAVRGQVINRRQIPITEHGHVPDDILIISSVKDKTAYTPFVKKGAKIYTSELILGGIVAQKLDYKRHELV